MGRRVLMHSSRKTENKEKIHNVHLSGPLRTPGPLVTTLATPFSTVLSKPESFVLQNFTLLWGRRGSLKTVKPPQNSTKTVIRLMTMSPLYPCGKPCSRGTHNETVKNLALFSSIISGIMNESRLRISIPWECFQFFIRIENSITFTP